MGCVSMCCLCGLGTAEVIALVREKFQALVDAASLESRRNESSFNVSTAPQGFGGAV